MIIKATKGVELAVFVSDLEITLVIHRPGEVEPIVASLSTNHCQALELAVSAARMEAEARAVGE